MKTILVTGSSRGIGSAICKAFANRGYNVYINYNLSEENALSLEKSLRESGFNSAAYKADVRCRNQVRKMIKDIGKIDILVNNAGISSQKLFTDISEEEWDNMFDTHVKGTFNCTQEVLPQMIQGRSGKIINISSIWGMVGASCEVHYSAAKAAIIGFTKALAKEVGPSNITVNCIAPGVIKTDMLLEFSGEDIKNLENETPLMRIGTPEDVANAALYLASADFVTGQVISPNGGIVI